MAKVWLDPLFLYYAVYSLYKLKVRTAFFLSQEIFCFRSWEPAALKHFYTWEPSSIWPLIPYLQNRNIRKKCTLLVLSVSICVNTNSVKNTKAMLLLVLFFLALAYCLTGVCFATGCCVTKWVFAKEFPHAVTCPEDLCWPALESYSIQILHTCCIHMLTSHSIHRPILTLLPAYHKQPTGTHNTHISPPPPSPTSCALPRSSPLHTSGAVQNFSALPEFWICGKPQWGTPPLSHWATEPCQLVTNQHDGHRIKYMEYIFTASIFRTY